MLDEETKKKQYMKVVRTMFRRNDRGGKKKEGRKVWRVEGILEGEGEVPSTIKISSKSKE